MKQRNQIDNKLLREAGVELMKKNKMPLGNITRGHSHGRALRTVADRLLYVVCTMLRNATLYQPPPDPQPSASAP